MNLWELTAPCHFGTEAVLKREILDLGYEICTEFPEKVGCDRLADIAGAISRYPLPLK